MRLLHLTSSTFFGGPERQMLGLANALQPYTQTSFISFPEGGRCTEFLEAVRSHGFEAQPLCADFPRLLATVRELRLRLTESKCDVVICHGYKAHILGRLASRQVGIPAVAVSRGWTGESRKVKLYEWLDRRHIPWMDHVVCVSEGQAEKVRRWCRVPVDRLSVIRNSARLAAFEKPDPTARHRLLALFPQDSGVTQVVLAAGRLSPEKGFDVLIDAATTVCQQQPRAGVVLFGEGVLRPDLEQRVKQRNLANRFLLPGYRTDLDALIGAADVVVLPSYTEGLPNVALEASAAGVPVVATAVGGTPEVVQDGETGYLVPAGEPLPLAQRICDLITNAERSRQFGAAGRDRMMQNFTFESQAHAYHQLIERVCTRPHLVRRSPESPARIATVSALSVATKHERIRGNS